MKVKKILRIPSRILKRINLSRNIIKFDRYSDEHFINKKYNLDNGWLKTSIDDILESPGISEKMRNSELHQKPDIGKKIYYNWNIPDFVWTALLKSKSIIDIAKGYIGPDARLDDLYIKTVVDGLESGAEGWHDDNVGYRLKVFMVFDVEGTPSDTLLIPRARPNLYNVKIRQEVMRMIGKPEKMKKEKEVRVNYLAGDCLIFDTNLSHRGDYSSSIGIRYCLVAEFIHRKKADVLREYSPCGPGQSAMQISIPINNKNFLYQHPLIDNTILEEFENKFKYGYKNSKKSLPKD